MTIVTDNELPPCINDCIIQYLTLLLLHDIAKPMQMLIQSARDQQ